MDPENLSANLERSGVCVIAVKANHDDFQEHIVVLQHILVDLLLINLLLRAVDLP